MNELDEFLNQMRTYILYWESQPISSREKLDGFAFSVLNIIDGTSALPPHDLVLNGKVINAGVMMHEIWATQTN